MSDGRTAARGIVLILSAALLAVLVALTLVLAAGGRMHRDVQARNVVLVKARLLARSGVEAAVARLGAGEDPGAATARYRGEDWDADGAVTGLEAAAEAFRPGEANLWDCPAEHAMRPTFYRPHRTDLDATGKRAPDRLRVDGRERGCSGRLRGDQGSMGNTYVLRVDDESAKINVNGGVLDTGNRDAAAGDAIPDHRDPDIRPDPGDPRDSGIGWNFHLARILDTLGTAREDNDGSGTIGIGEDWDRDGAVDPPPIGIAGMGQAILAARPAGGYRSIAQVQAALGTTVDLSPYLTVSSWVDPRAFRPNAYAGQENPLMRFEAIDEVKRDRLPPRWDEGGRPPVNLNAAPVPVLFSLLSGLRGTCWVHETHPVVCEIPPAIASQFALAISEFRAGLPAAGRYSACGSPPGPFRTWEQFGVFCDAQAGQAPVGLCSFHGFVSGPWGHIEYGGGNLMAADLVKANFDPNAALVKGIPDQIAWRWIDKSDLLVGSTEGSLGPTGVFGVRSYGRVLGADGTLSACAQARADARMYAPLPLTTQADFVSGRTLADSPRYLSLADPDVCRTYGAEAGAAWWGGAVPIHPIAGMRAGLGVVKGPSPVTALPASADPLDGSISLATVEQDRLDPPGGDLRVALSFDDSWDAEDAGVAGAVLVRQDGTLDDRLQPSPAVGTWPAPGQDAGTLRPEGAHIQADRVPAYDAGAVPERGRHGAVSLWVKEAARRGHVHGDRPAMFWSLRRPGAGGTTQALLLGDDSQWWGILVERDADAADGGHERLAVEYRFEGGVRLLGPRWKLMTALWDMDETAAGAVDARCWVEGMASAGAVGSIYLPFTAGDTDLAPPGALMNLGGQTGTSGGEARYYASQIVDEMALCDFGDDGAAALAACDPWRQRRYADGRYYKGNDGEFLSGIVEPCGGVPVRLVRVGWTGYVPRAARQECGLNAGALSGVRLPRAQDATLQPARIEVDLMDDLYSGALASAVVPGASPGVGTLSRFVYRVRFLPTPDWNAATRDNSPVLESPVFDDITFYWRRATGPVLSSWSED